MGEQSGNRLNHRSAACKFPSELVRKKQQLRPRRIIMAMSLTLILTASGLVVLQPPPAIPPPPPSAPSPLQLTPHSAIAIDGDANFSATALLEGWPGDGSPEIPFIIDGLEIDLGGEDGNCIMISNTRVSFTISNCNLTGAGAPGPMSTGSFGAGIRIVNVRNGEIVNNTCSDNSDGIIVQDGSDSNIVANNICINNTPPWFGGGISVDISANNIVVNNTCSSNVYGISLGSSSYNTVENNICNNNLIGIYLEYSDSNTVANNNCNYNDIGILIEDSYLNVVVNNTFLGNTEHDIVGEYMTEEAVLVVFLLIGFLGIMMLGAVWKLVTGIRKFNLTKDGRIFE
ncbi:MAG: right-handed parallel beta-helix repeat-containing protein [Candidatus Thorarchaeota archaeon]